MHTRLAGLFILLATACLSLSGQVCLSAPVGGEMLAARSADLKPAGAEALYHKVWKLIRDNYYDPTYNRQIWERWENRYDSKLKTSADAHKAIETMLASLGDRYTRFLDPSAFEDEKMQIAAHLFGIGVQIGLDKTQKVVVIAPIEGTPAAAAGLRPGDIITAVDGSPTKGISLLETSKKIRGPAGSKVELTIFRDGKDLKVNIIRAKILLKSVHKVKMLNKDIGYIRLSTFMSERANYELREALAKLSPARGVILDLRGNPGGLLTNAVDVSSMFLDGGVVVSTVDRNGRKVSARCRGKPISKQSLVVLINKGSASASEITSGALKDHGRAELVGETTFGKGLVQSVNRLDDGSGVNVTIARYVTPNNIDINKKGIVPDHTVKLAPEDYKEGKGPWWFINANEPITERTPDAQKDIQLAKAVEVLEARIKNSGLPYELKLNLPTTGLTF